MTMDDLMIIKNKIYEIRGQKVMLDFDLADAYGIETSQLKRQVRRNIEDLLGEVGHAAIKNEEKKKASRSFTSSV